MNFKTDKKRIFLSPPHMGGEELDFIAQAIATNYIAPLGPQVTAFEAAMAELAGTSAALALSSGTAALHLALRALNIGPGDEVIASSFTFVGSINPIIYQGATPVFIDSDFSSWNMDPDLLAEEIESCKKRNTLPKAVIPTDIYGQSADIDRINAACRPYGIPVICDSAEALGAEYKGKPVGSTGVKASMFSFNGNKIITTSGGGILVSDDHQLIEQARFLSQQARDTAIHYEHSQIGYNYRLSNISAAIGLAQLKKLKERVEQKRHIFEYYQKHLGTIPGIQFMPEALYGTATRWLTTCIIRPQEFGATCVDIYQALEKNNIEARPLWKPMHMQPVFKEYRMRGGKVCEELFKYGLCLPSGTTLSYTDLDRIIAIIIDTGNK